MFRPLAILVLVISLLSSGLSFAEKTTMHYHFDSYDQAGAAPSYLRFDMIQREIGGLRRSKFSGFVEDFVIRADVAKDSFQNCVLRMSVKDIDLDSDLGNGKLRNDSLDIKHHPQIEVTFPNPLKVGSQTSPSVVQLRGEIKTLAIPVDIKESGNIYVITGHTHTTLSQLGIPKPKFISASIASVEDPVDIFYRLVIPKNQINH